MSSAQRRKLTAALGVLAMLLGAFMVVVPNPAGAVLPTPYGVYGDGDPGESVNLFCDARENQDDLTDGTAFADYRADTDDDAPLNFPGLSEVDGMVTPVADTDPLELEWSTQEPVQIVIVKQSHYSAVFVVNGAKNGTVWVAVPEGDDTTYSHVTFCAGEQQQEQGELRIVKNVTGEVPANWSFGFTVDGDGTDPTLEGTSVVVTDQDTQTLPVGTYVVSEPAAGAAELVSIDCGEGETVEPTIAADAESGSATVTVSANELTVCTFTNQFPTSMIVTIPGDPPTTTTTTTTTTTVLPTTTTSVLPDEVTTTTEAATTTEAPTTTAAPVTTAASVEGDVVVRTLPRTGDGTRDLAGVGAALIGLGAALVIGSRRRQAMMS